MSAPREILPGSTYLITRRVLLRLFLLRPSPDTNRIFLYCLAYAAWKTRVALHVFCAMSNHWHGALTDPEGRLPEFLQVFHRLVAAALNVSLARVENLWAAEATSVVRLDHPDDILEKLAYVIANPVTAGLVKHPADWPGVITRGLGESFIVTRPKSFFREDGNMPEQITLTCTLPPALAGMGMEAAKRRIRRLVQEHVRRARRTIRAEGRTFLGADGVRTMPLDRSGTTPEPRRKRRPTFVAREPERREAALRRQRAFRTAYRVAFDRWRGGDRNVRFPEGTYRMRVLHRAQCGPPPLG